MEQVAWFGAFPATSVHVADDGLNVPVEFVVKVTVPAGTVGLVELSITLAVQLADVLTEAEPGLQVTTIFVEWSGGGTAEETAAVKLPVLVAGVEWPWCCPVLRGRPAAAALGVYATEHEALLAAAPGTRVQVAEVGLNVPVELVVKLMEPVGVDGLGAEASATVAVQLVGLLTWTDAGEH